MHIKDFIKDVQGVLKITSMKNIKGDLNRQIFVHVLEDLIMKRCHFSIYLQSVEILISVSWFLFV